ncbi:putative secreted protein (Por secretion system target) [Flavobacterium araucananum]|uniref:Secretion system C-terminal sorting domain-containing protein n=1 Tax=Flavobacterium araucananum TaxID=946678 RepID=A0A227NSU1_9FLAO|nr:T9SS type A sorting domain-containing protein [Flavobacterium araucananum]OXG00770.1 hypothetical protein B0A64_19285 [Flavobacterium araucananum]PWK03332.1 putative secreted protein (Por secretion system target) [Flavobacterium araucananum]
MKNFYLLIILLVSGFGFAQQQKYIIKISNLNYSINAGVKNRTSSNIRITVRYKDGSSSDAYTRDIRNNGDKEANLDIAAFNRNSKPVSIECYAFVNFRTGTDANSTVSKSVDSFCPSGSFSGSYSPRMSNITFTYKIDPVFSVNRSDVVDDILPTHRKETIIATPGYDAYYYRWQYTLLPNGTSTVWTDLPQYNNAPSITVDAVDILKDKTYLNIGKNIYFRIKPCTETAGLSTPVSYSIRLSAPQILTSASIQPTCSDSQDGSIKLSFSRILLNGEQLRYTLLDVGTGTPSDYNGDLLIDANKNFTITGLRAGTYTLQLLGFKDGLNTSVTPADLYALTTFTIASPPILDFTLSATDVQCNGGQDGTITIAPTGGTRTATGNDSYSLDDGLTWIPFPNNNSHTIKNLPPGTYKIKVRDMKGCIAKIQTLVDGKIKLGADKVLEKTISQPLFPLALSYTLKNEPTFYGAANGKIVAAITGGTINDDRSYTYEWKNSSGVVLPATGQYNTTDNTYNITLENVPQGEYKLTVTDKNYNNTATNANKAGCSVIESSQTLTQPQKIVITLEETKAISCNTENHDPITGNANKLSDAVLKATVIGGVKYTGTANNGLPYKFIWSKYNTVTSSWEVLTDYKTDTATGLAKGNYSLNIVDANGIVQGTYNATDLVTAIPATKEIAEPIKLELSFTSGNVSCHEGNNGWATATVTGGAGDYKYVWFNTGSGIVDANKISQLILGTYIVTVSDKNGCSVTGSIKITEPQAPVVISYKEIFTPTFSGATNGRIVAEITGGTAFDGIENNGKLYNYEWKNSKGAVQTATAVLENGIYTITLNGVPADDYFLTIKDKNYNEATSQTINCSVLESKITLDEPDPLKVVFEIVRSISCNTGNEFGNATDTTPQDGQRDESQDGILVAHVFGGTPLASAVNNGLPYYFYWKKQQQDGSWVALPTITNETASNLSHGNYALNIKDRNGIMLGTYVNNVLTQEIDVTQMMQEPPKLSVTINHGDVFCNGGNDGWATAVPAGGTPPYTYVWSNEVKIDENTVLKAGTYVVYVTDFKECTTQASVTILEPKTPLAIKYTEVLNPSFYKATNGKIVVEVTGGTIFPDNTYWFEWKNSKGIVQTTTTTNFNDGVYTITLNGVPEELYSLTVRDVNYNAAKNKTSCTVANSVTALDDPDPLEVTFEVVRTISCNVSNEFGNETDVNPLDNQRDESHDGILVAHVKGGIQLKADKNNGLPYFYTWKKQKGNTWITLNDHDETAEYLSDGNYALNIEDANGIKLGTYVNNILVEEKDVTYYMPEPAKLQLSFTKFDVGCTTGDDGWAMAHVSGGTPPYTYEWTNGETTAEIKNITTNNYFVIATDAKGCVIQGSIFVGDPNGIFTTETVKNPTCYNGNDASIVLNVTGGNLPYSYVWNTGATTKDLNNLTAGNYEVAITCPDCCVYKKRFVLKDPEPVIVNVGPDRTLCKDQNLDLDATIADPKAKYSWTSTNGFSSSEAKINVSKAGTYSIKVTSGLGCIGTDEIVIKTSQTAISSEFLLSSQAYLDEEVILINTSSPFGESTNWVIPKGVKVVEQKEKYITLKFDATGVYSIGLQQTQGECYATYSKNITVEQRSTLPSAGGTTSQFIVDFIVTPNPSNGNFKAHITLENDSDVNLRLFSTTGQNTMIQKKESGKKKYEIDFETSLESGMYVLVLETGQQTLVKKIIIY